MVRISGSITLSLVVLALATGALAQAPHRPPVPAPHAAPAPRPQAPVARPAAPPRMAAPPARVAPPRAAPAPHPHAPIATDRRAPAHRTTARHARAGHRCPVAASRSASCGATGRTLAHATTRVSANQRAITRPCQPPAGSTSSHPRLVATRAAHRPRATRNATRGAQ